MLSGSSLESTINEILEEMVQQLYTVHVHVHLISLLLSSRGPWVAAVLIRTLSQFWSLYLVDMCKRSCKTGSHALFVPSGHMMVT